MGFSASMCSSVSLIEGGGGLAESLSYGKDLLISHCQVKSTDHPMTVRSRDIYITVTYLPH